MKVTRKEKIKEILRLYDGKEFEDSDWSNVRELQSLLEVFGIKGWKAYSEADIYYSAKTWVWEENGEYIVITAVKRGPYLKYEMVVYGRIK